MLRQVLRDDTSCRFSSRCFAMVTMYLLILQFITFLDRIKYRSIIADWPSSFLASHITLCEEIVFYFFLKRRARETRNTSLWSWASLSLTVKCLLFDSSVTVLTMFLFPALVVNGQIYLVSSPTFLLDRSSIIIVPQCGSHFTMVHFVDPSFMTVFQYISFLIV